MMNHSTDITNAGSSKAFCPQNVMATQPTERKTYTTEDIEQFLADNCTVRLGSDKCGYTGRKYYALAVEETLGDLIEAGLTCGDCFHEVALGRYNAMRAEGRICVVAGGDSYVLAMNSLMRTLETDFPRLRSIFEAA
jgi:hypothetical protein